MLGHIFVASTFFNPAYRGVLSSDQVQESKQFVKQTTEHQCATNDHHMVDGFCFRREETCNERQTSEQSEELQAKRFKHLSTLRMLLEKEETNEKATTTTNCNIELNEYFTP